jgi:cellulose synthase/poly-beta-1,6-N-acetylglucosamine synthase-like glycosyltransferase
MMILEILKLVFLGIQLLLFIYFLLTTIYFLLFSVAGLFPVSQTAAVNGRQNRFAVLIPGYKEDAVILDVARQALNQDYPAEFYDVVIIADSFSKETLAELRKLPLQVIEVVFEISSKAKALNEAVKRLPGKYDAAMILDADNIMAKDCLVRMNEALNNGYSAIQGHRTAKNRNTSFAVLDSVSEEINNHIFRKGHRVLGLSSALIGSGMAFDYLLFKNHISQIDSTGEDKELEIRLINAGIKIEYLYDAYIFDEKVQKSMAFMVQRTRWLANQLIYAKRYFLWSVRQLITKGNLDLFDKLLQQLLPPRIFLLGFLVLFSVLSILINPVIYTCAWGILTALCILTLMFSTPLRFYNWKTFKAIFLLPKGFFMMLLSLTRIYHARRKWYHTVHGLDNG